LTSRSSQSSVLPRPWSLGSVAVTVSLACASPALPPHPIAPARQLVPVPICLATLPPSASSANQPLEPAAYWPLLLPGFDPHTPRIDPLTHDCSGRQPFASAESTSTLVPRVDASKVATTSDQFEIIWLPIRVQPDRPGSGVLALARQRERRLEVYAIGVHGGDPERTVLSWQRLGSRLIVSALDACDDKSKSASCESTASIYLVRHGRLLPLATLPLERTTSGPRVAGGGGPTEYHFHGSLKYAPDGIHISEQLSVRDSVRGEIRRSDLERVLVLHGDDLVESEPSLWQQTLGEMAGNAR
jgi:hypothetical protein